MKKWTALGLILCLIGSILGLWHFLEWKQSQITSAKYIKWVDFNIPVSAMRKAVQLDIEAYKEGKQVNWIELLAYTGTRYGGNWKRYKAKDLEKIAKELKNGKSIKEISKNMKYYNYFFEAYDAVLHNFVGEYSITVPDPNDASKMIEKKEYGIKVYSPIAAGRYYNHCDDFGNARSYGFKRKHLGNDLMGSVGTPIIAVESGYVEAIGWNRYGGWRIGIRSLDKKRYYYYAHLKKNHPYHASLYEGKIVKAGDVIGYLGMTGYSTKENTNNIKMPHLHFGIQLIFDESQKEGNNEIWIDVYQIVQLLEKYRSSVVFDDETGEYDRKYNFLEHQ